MGKGLWRDMKGGGGEEKKQGKKKKRDFYSRGEQKRSEWSEEMEEKICKT